VTTVKRQYVIDAAAETKLPVVSKLAILMRIEIDDMHTPAARLHVVVSNAPSAADPLLASGAVSVLRVYIASDDGFLIGRAVEDDQFALMTVASH
jgi:hypothetical protein